MRDLVLVTPPAEEPITLDQAKKQLRLEDTDADDDYLRDELIPEARDAVESFLRRVIITQTWRLKLDGFPGYGTRFASTGYPEIRLPNPPFHSIISFQYVDVGGVLQALTQETNYGNDQNALYGYQLDPGGETQPARLLPPFARPWPPCRLVPNNVIIEYVCGYGKHGPDPDDETKTIWIGRPIPPAILSAIRKQISWLYEFRGDDPAGNDSEGLAPGVRGLLLPYRNLLV